MGATYDCHLGWAVNFDHHTQMDFKILRREKNDLPRDTHLIMLLLFMKLPVSALFVAVLVGMSAQVRFGSSNSGAILTTHHELATRGKEVERRTCSLVCLYRKLRPVH